MILNKLTGIQKGYNCVGIDGEEGQKKRIKILRRYYPDVNQVVEKFLADVPCRKKIDDVIDALCLAVIGKIILEKGLKTIPENPMMDGKGIIMQMVYGE